MPPLLPSSETSPFGNPLATRLKPDACRRRIAGGLSRDF